MNETAKNNILIKEGNQYWHPSDGNIYNLDGELIAHDAVFRPGLNTSKINIDNFKIVDDEDNKNKSNNKDQDIDNNKLKSISKISSDKINKTQKRKIKYYSILEVIKQGNDSCTWGPSITRFVGVTESEAIAKDVCNKYSNLVYIEEFAEEDISVD